MTDTKPPLPEPVAWLHTERNGTTVFVDADDGEGCPDCQPLFTREQLAAAVAQERERCALVCEARARIEDVNPAEALLEVAAAIREKP